MKSILKIAIYCMIILGIATAFDSAQAEVGPESFIYMPIISNSEPTPSNVIALEQKPMIRINDSIIYQDQMVIVTIEASNLDGLSTAVVNITYDPNLFSVHSCDVDPDRIFESRHCNPAFAPNTLQFVIISSSGMSGNIPMAKIAFQSNSATYSGSVLDIDVVSFSKIDGTIPSVDVIDGVVANFDCSLVSQIPQNECQALVDIYRGHPAYFEHNRDNWLDLTEPCNWAGITCEDGHVTELNLKPVITYEHVYEGSNEGGQYVARITNPLSSLAPAIGNLIHLEKLYFEDSSLIDLPSEIGNLSNLVALDLDDNNLVRLPSGIGNLSSLTTLELQDNNLSSLPSEIGNMMSLTSLSLTGNKLGSLPPEIGNMASLTTLNLNNNNLTNLPSEIGNMASLTTLNLHSNNLVSLPSEIGNMASLTTLNLNNNNLVNLPSEIGNMANLTTLNLNSNNLVNLPSQIGNMASLATLDINGNSLVSLPAEVGDMSSLVTLELAHNNLSRLPPTIGDLSSLSEINLLNNDLESLPNEIGQLLSLTRLNLSKNSLRSLPVEVGNLSNLTGLFLNGNQLMALPNEIQKLTKLAYMSLDGNRLEIDDSGLAAFLTRKDSNWISTQAIPPTDVSVFYTEDAIWLLWTPMRSEPLRGGGDHSDYYSHYEISTAVADTYTVHGITDDTNSDVYLLTGLSPGATYNIRIRAYIPIVYSYYDEGLIERWTLDGEYWSDYTTITTTVPSSAAGLYCLQVSQITQGECEALAELHDSAPDFFDHNKDYWFGGSEICDWEGVGCKDGHVMMLDLEAQVIEYPLYELTSAIGRLPFLEQLILNENSLNSLPPEIGNLSKLTKLSLNNNSLDSLPTEMGNLSKLAEINLNNNRFNSLPHEIRHMDRLTILNLNENYLVHLPAEIDNLANLTQISLSNNHLVDLPPEIGNLTNLTALNLDGNDLVHLPAEVGNLANLSKLDLSNNQLESLPGEIGNLTSLVELALSTNTLRTLPPEISNLSNLTELSLDGNRLITLPAEISNLTGSIDLEGNQLQIEDGELATFLTSKDHDWSTTQAIPPTNFSAEVQSDGAVWLQWTPIQGEPIREGPYYSYYEISTATTDTDIDTYTVDTYTAHGKTLDTTSAHYIIGGLAPDKTYKIRVRTYIPIVDSYYEESIQNWELAGEYWSDSPGIITITTPSSTSDASSFNCRDVEEIYPNECEALLAFYYSTDGPNWTYRNGWLKNKPPCSWYGLSCHEGYVVDLMLEGMGLTGAIPPEIGNFSKLEYLDLGGNQLQTIPSEIGNLSNLRHLSLAENQLQTIPPDIGNLSSLERLNLADNQLQTIPSEISNLANLTDLNIDYNYISVTDSDLLTFLDETESDWAETQYLPPAELGALILTDHSMKLLWTPVQWKGDGGHYEISIATGDSSEDAFTVHGITSDQITNTYLITGLTSTASYQVRVRSYFPQSDASYEETWSDYSDMISITLPSSADSPLYNCGAVSEIPQIECEALLALYHSTDGPNWGLNTGWLETMPCYWYGIECDNGHVQSINAHANRLVGTIPPEIGNLSGLTFLNLSYNKLENIPSTISELSNLTTLILVYNEFESIPSEIGSLVNLEYLGLSGNPLSGLPPEIINLSDLEHLELKANHFAEFPTETLTLLNLQSLWLDGNLLTTIPPEIVKLSKLEELGISYNRIVATDVDLQTFLDTKSRDWAKTQTVAPSGLAITPLSGGDIQLQWEPIPFQDKDGYYEISIATEGPFEADGITEDKSNDNYIITDLQPDITYKIRIRTYTSADSDEFMWQEQPNELWSDYSDVISVALPAAPENRSKIYIKDFTIYRNQTVFVTVEASDLDHLGSTDVSITYDPAVLSVLDCSLDPDKMFDLGVCDLDSAADTLRFKFISLSSTSGDMPLVEIAFQSNNATNSSSMLDINVPSFLNAEGVSLAVDAVDSVVTISDEVGLDCSLVRQISQSECQALVDIYKGESEFFEDNRESWLGTTEPCDWEGVGCQDGHVTTLDLQPRVTSENRLDSLPDEIGNLSSLTELNLSFNKLESLPPAIGNLTHLNSQGLSLAYNRISTTDPVLQAFLDEQDSQWADTQTVAPAEITATAISDTSIQLTWTPIPLQIEGGYYEINMATEDEEFTVHGVTASTTEESYTIDELTPDTAYQIRLRTYTPAHSDNDNQLWSLYSDVISVTTLTNEEQ